VTRKWINAEPKDEKYPVKRDAKGRWLTFPEGVKPVKIDSARGRELAKRRWELQRERAAEARDFAVKSLWDQQLIERKYYKGIPDGYTAMIGHATEIYMTSTAARGLAELGKFIQVAAGDIPSASDDKDQSQPIPTALLHADAIIAAYEYYRSHKDVIDAQVRDVT
jgi:hypothetical protein